MKNPQGLSEGLRQPADSSVVFPNGQPASKDMSEPADSESTQDGFCLALFQTGTEDNFISSSLAMRIRHLVEDNISLDEKPDIDLWLESAGGSADAAYKIMLILRQYGGRIRVVIPDFAKSAATLMALGADEIVMGPSAELGPLDAQIQHYEFEGRTISALDYADSVEYLAGASMRMVISGGALILQTTGLTRKECLSSVLDFAAQFMEPIVSKLDPSLIHQSSNQLRIASEYAERLMGMRQLDEADQKLVEPDLPTYLVTNYPAHGFVISPEEASSLGLPIRKPNEYRYWEPCSLLHRQTELSGEPVLHLFNFADLTDKGDNDEQE